VKFVSPFNPVHLESDPSAAVDGDLYFNSSSNVFRYHFSGSWASLYTTLDSQKKVFNFGGDGVLNFTESINESHQDSTVIATCTASCTILLPDDSVLDLQKGFRFTLVRGGIGKVNLGEDYLLFYPDPNYLNARWQSIDVIKIGPDSWIIDGEFPDIY
jgi:hypothetical protein